MNLGMQANIGQTQEQTLSPALLQSVKMLQKTSQELETAIKEEVEVNPLLEVDDGDFDDQEVPVDKDPEELDPRANDSSEFPDDIEDMARGSLDDTADVDSSYLDGESTDVNWDSYLGDGTSYDDAPFNDLNSGSKDPDEDWDRPIKDVGKSLQEQLEDQLRLWNGTRELQEQLQENGVTEEHFRKLVQYLINSINDDGFLCDSSREGESEAMVVQSDDKYIDEIERVLRGELKLEDASLPVREAVHVLQSFKPSGIGARDQRECFLIQAYAIPNFPSLAIRILEKEYENLLQLRYAKIAKALNVSADEVKTAVASLSR